MTNTFNAPSPIEAAATALPLRPDDPVSVALVIKILLVMAVLLAMTYLVLRWYAGRSRSGLPVPGREEALVCTAALRLSPRTRVYRVRSGATDILITESASGVSVTVLPARAGGAGPEPSA